MQKDRIYCQELSIRTEDKEQKCTRRHRQRTTIRSRILEIVLSRHGTKNSCN